MSSQITDHWRRFHLTVKPGSIVRPENISKQKFWCPNCGKMGHLVHQCPAFNPNFRPEIVVTVVTYDEVAENTTAKSDGDVSFGKSLYQVNNKKADLSSSRFVIW